MKIIKISDFPTSMQTKRLEANKGCDICPCCGNKNVRHSLDPFTYTKGFLFWKKYYRIDCYKCNNCDAQWQSELFEIESV